MALRLSLHQAPLLAAVLMIPATSTCAADPSSAGIAPEKLVAAAPSAPLPERVQIQSGPATGIMMRDMPADLVLRIVTPEDSESLKRTGLAKVFGDNRPQYALRNALPGRSIDTLPHPATSLMPGMAKGLVAGYFRHAPDAQPAESSTLRFGAEMWALVHQGNRRDNPSYRLNHRTTVEQLRADGTRADTLFCSDESRAATLDEWQADDYALVKQSSVLFALDCVGKLARKMPAFYPRPLATEDLSIYADGKVPPARVRVFGGAGRGVTLLTDAVCRSDYRGKIDVRRSNARAIGGLFGGAPDNITIGIPETDSVRNMKSVLFSMPNYEEYEVPGGKPLILEARIENSGAYYCDGGLSGQFVTKPGQDYEVEMEVADSTCRLHIRQVHADGSLSPQPVRPTPKDCARAGAAERIVPHEAMNVLLFSADHLQIQPAAEGAVPLQLRDDASSNEAVQQMLQQASDTPGTRLCVVVPSSTFISAMRDTVWNRVLEAPQVLPSLLEEAATVNQRRGAAADAPVDLASAVAHCKAIPIKSFAGY